MTQPFRPIGDRARWKSVYELMRKTGTGGVITYAMMGAALNLDPDADRAKIQMAARRAATELLNVDLRSTEAIRNRGYQVVETSRKLEIARKYQGRAARAVRKGQAHVTHADLANLDPDTRAVFEAMAWKFEQQDEALRRLDVRARRHERQLAAAQSAQQQTSVQMTELAARLAALEAAREPAYET
jgi:hypothetical protein